MTERLARACAQRPWRTLALWALAIVLAVVAVGALLPGRLTSEAHVTNDAESERANVLLDERLPAHELATELVIVRSERYTVDDPAFRAEVERLYVRGAETRAITHAVSYHRDSVEALVSPDRHAALIAIRLADPETESVEKVTAALRELAGRGEFEVGMTGVNILDHDFGEVSQHDLEEGELRYGLPAALIVLVLVFGALVAASLPLLLAFVSIVVALGLTSVVASGFELSIFVVNMLTGMGLALGIDYALFVVSRFREERAAGRDQLDAIAAAGATASRAVLFSGFAFVLAMTGLLLVQTTLMRSLAVGALLVAIVSVVAALTLLPAVLSLLGDRVGALRLPLVGRGTERESRLWSAIVRRVVRRPVVSLLAAVALLLVAASPVLGMKSGAAGISTLPDRLLSKQGYTMLERSFPNSGAQPARIVVDGDASSPAVRRAIERLRDALARDGRFGAPELQTAPTGDLVLLSVPVAADATSERAIEAVERLRGELIPAAFAGSGAEALVTGATAENMDYFAVMDFWLPLVIVFVLGLSLLLLTVAFRSVVVAATAIVLNVLSVGAAYGLMVAVFQEGLGAGLLGFQQVDTIDAWVPLFLFAVLFGLSMDYQVFLLSRIRERYSRTRDTTDAVSFGIASTGRIITGAALIIVAVFLGFAAGELVMFQQMGFGIAIALLVDATIVRSVLVPAAMQLLGERNWYLPAWLEWLPHVEVEGHTAEAPSSEPA